MTKKRQPLRAAAAVAPSSKVSEGAKRQKVEDSVASHNTTKSSSSAKRSDEDDENDDDDEDDEDDDDDEEDDDIALEGQLHFTEPITFEFNDPKEEYAESITVLLKQFVQNPTKAYSLASRIASQVTPQAPSVCYFPFDYNPLHCTTDIVGTVVTCEGSLDVFAFATVLPLNKQKQYGTDDALNMIVLELATAVGALGNDAGTSFLQCVTGSRICTTGIFLHKRFSNLPLELVGALHSNLEEDLGWSQQMHESEDGVVAGKDCSSDKSEFRSLQYVLLIAAASIKNEGKLLASGKAVDVLGSNDVLFEAFEDDIFAQNATAAYLFKSKVSTTNLVAALIPIASLKKCINSVRQLIPVSTAPTGK